MKKTVMHTALIALALSMSCTTPLIAKESRAEKIHKPHAVVAETAVVDINSADLKALRSVKGIGVKRAQAILDYRQEHGAFQSVNELTKVKGVTAKTLEKIVANNPDRLVAKTGKS